MTPIQRHGTRALSLLEDLGQLVRGIGAALDARLHVVGQGAGAVRRADVAASGEDVGAPHQRLDAQDPAAEGRVGLAVAVDEHARHLVADQLRLEVERLPAVGTEAAREPIRDEPAQNGVRVGQRSGISPSVSGRTGCSRA